MNDIKKFYLERSACLCGQCSERSVLKVWSEEDECYCSIMIFLQDLRLDDDVLLGKDIPDILELFIEFLKAKDLLEEVEIDKSLLSQLEKDN